MSSLYQNLKSYEKDYVEPLYNYSNKVTLKEENLNSTIRKFGNRIYKKGWYIDNHKRILKDD